MRSTAVRQGDSAVIHVQVNGIQRQLPEGADVAELVADLGGGPRGVAVALNGAVVPRAAWPSTVLRAGDRVEVLTAVQGG
jgi:sulfur carrier protein